MQVGGTFGDFKELLNAKSQNVILNLKIKSLIVARLIETIIK
jgi:hypothetical protein